MIIDSTGQMVAQVFCIGAGKNITSPYSPLKDEVVKLGTDVTISIDGIIISYTAGDIVGLYKGRTYTLSASTDVHVM